jgi:hypothetical protein
LEEAVIRFINSSKRGIFSFSWTWIHVYTIF